MASSDLESFAAAHICINGTKARASDYLRALSGSQLALLITCCTITLATICIYAEEMYHLQTKMHKWSVKRKALVLLAIYPVTSLNSTFALLMPRASGLADLTVSIYYALCVFLFSQMLFQHFGGKAKMTSRLDEAVIPLRSPPLCCLFFCLPKPTLNINRLNMIEFCVLQFVVVKPLAMYIVALMVVDAGPTYILQSARSSAIMYQTVGILNSLSTLLAVYGNVLLFRMSAATLKHVNIGAKFYLLQVVVMLENIQKLFLSILVSAGAITCALPLDTTSTSNRIHHQLLVFEMVLLSVVARVYYRHDVMSTLPLEDVLGQSTASATDGSTTDYGATDRGASAVATSEEEQTEQDRVQRHDDLYQGLDSPDTANII